ncbi:MAG: hypothetical protein RL557_84 [archaeon]|jgi:UDPglucose 6-dehydrogenase
MKIGIIGAGVVGGITGKILATKHEVSYYDKFKSEFHDITKVAAAEIIFICVSTPMKPSGEMDYSAIHNSLEYLLQNIQRDPRDTIVIIRSTAVSGTTDALAKKFPFQFAFNPEFLREKHAEEDMKNTSRIVIGANNKQVNDKVVAMYKELFPNATYLSTDIKTAEMIKYAANVFLASQIAIANELFGICTAVGVDYNTVKDAILHDDRIGKNIQVPGHDGDFGFGGKCFPKDLNGLMYLARNHHYRPYLLEEVWRLNSSVRKKKDWLDIQGATTDNDFKKS